MKICAVIPCYNEAKTISDIVTEASNYVDCVVVADNGSCNGTTAEALKAGADTISCSIKGYGANLSAGIKYILNKSDIIVTLDGDGQHKPCEIVSVVEPLINGDADIVIGSRFMGINKTPYYRRLGIKIINVLYNIGSGYAWICDTQSCFRAFRREVLEKITIEEKGFGASTEMLIKGRKLGYRIMEIPISCIYHGKFSDNSTINPVNHGVAVAWATLKWRIKCRS